MPNYNLKFSRATCAAVLPLIALLVWTAVIDVTRKSGTSYRVGIVGYDPIDLLSGHYLRFRYDFGNFPICQEGGVDLDKVSRCACVAPDENQRLTAVQALPCDQAQRVCQTLIKGQCSHGAFLTGSERFYCPEQYASALALVPVGSSAEISLIGGQVALRNIFVGDQPIFEYAQMTLAAPKP